MLVHVHNIVTLVRACLHGGKRTQIGEITCGGSTHLSHDVHMFKLKWEIIWTGGLPHLSQLPHLPGVPHLLVNRPLVCVAGGIIHATCGECKCDNFFFFCGWAARVAASRRQNLQTRKNKRLFSLFVLFSHFRQHNDAPDNFFFQMLSYARESTCICMHNYWNSLENIPWSELGKQSTQAKKVYSASYAGCTLVGWSLLKNIFYTKLAFFFLDMYFFLSFFF